MSKTEIPWAQYSINPVKGLCPVDCKDLEGKEYCYARKMYKRFKWNPEIRFEPIRDTDLPKKPSRIFVGSTMELFDEWVDAFWLDSIFKTVKDNPKHTFIFLTKRPQNLAKWEFPPNCWVGASADSYFHLFKATRYLPEVKARVKFISFEPLLESMVGPRFNLDGINWLIIGSQTQPVRHPEKEWCREIIKAADKAGVAVFVKEPLVTHIGIKRQEFPK